MNPRISVSAMCSVAWTLDEDLAFYERSGISRVGLSFEKMLQSVGGDLGRVATVARRVADTGIDVTNMLGLGVFDLASPEGWPRHEQRLLAAVEVGGIVGTDCLVALTGPAGPLTWEDASDALVAATAGFLRAAADARLVVALEHTNALRMDVSFLHTLVDTVDVAERLGLEVCMDVAACWTERSLAATIGRGAGHLALVQVADWKVGTRCTPDRAIPGAGDIPLRRILGEVLAAGYGGPLDLEILGPSADQIGYETVIGGGVRWLDLALDELGARPQVPTPTAGLPPSGLHDRDRRV